MINAFFDTIGILSSIASLISLFVAILKIKNKYIKVFSVIAIICLPFLFNVYRAKTQYISMPNLIGKELEQSKALIIDSKLRIGPLNNIESEDYEKGRILSQSPRANTYVPCNTIVNLTISEGSNFTKTPNVINTMINDAIKSLTKQGLTIGEVKYIPHKLIKKNLVLSQSPNPGEKVEIGNRINIIVSSGNKVKVPNLSGVNETEASKILKEFQLNQGSITYIKNTEIPKGKIIQQSITPNKIVNIGTTINLVISKKPMPDTKLTDLSILKYSDGEGYASILSPGISLKSWDAPIDTDNCGNKYDYGLLYDFSGMSCIATTKCTAIYNLNSNYSVLKGKFVLHSNSKNIDKDNNNYAFLTILGDNNKVLYRSEVLTGGVVPQTVYADVENTKTLCIQLTCGGSGNYKAGRVMVGFVEPLFYK